MKTLFSKIIILSFISFLFTNCSSSGGSDSTSTQASEYYFECKIDGVLKTFNNRLTSLRYLNSENKEIDFGGFSENSINVVPSFNIQLGSFLSGVVIIPKTYTEPANNIPGNGVLASYANGTTFLYSTVNSDPKNFTVIISELNNTFVKGTFSGIMKDSQTGILVTVTEGRFYVKHCTSNC